MDEYGFEREDDFDYETYERIMSEYLVVLTRRAVKWDKVVDPQHRTRKSVKGSLEFLKIFLLVIILRAIIQLTQELRFLEQVVLPQR